MTPKSLTFLCRSLDPGGSERQLLLLAGRLVNHGLSINIITFYPASSMVFDVPQGVTVTCLDKKGRWDTISFFRRLRKETKNCYIIHSYLTVTNVLAVLLKMFSPRLKVVWGIRASKVIWPDWLSRFAAWLERRLSPFADGIIVNSEAGKDYLQKQGYRNQHIDCIPNGVETQRFYPRSERPWRQTWGIQDQEILIGLVGRIDPMKDHETFFHAAQLVRQILPQTRFVYVGDGPQSYKDRLQALVESLSLNPFLQWHPACSEIERLYPCLDLLCSCSAFGEGSSNVLLEALACGIPCIATDVGDNRRILNGYGLIVPPRDAQALAEAIITSSREHSNKDSASYIQEKYSAEILAHKTLSTLQKWKVI